MESPHIRILADDLTGALDSAAVFAGNIASAAVPIFIDQPSNHRAQVQAVSTASRDIPVSAIAQALQPCLPWFCQPGVLSFKKIDSLLRGNTFAELAWLMQSGQFEGLVFAPAFPSLGRFTQGGQHWSGPAAQPRAPRQHSHPQSLAQALASVGLTARLGNQVPQTGQVSIPDVLCDADLASLAQLSARPEAQRWLWCGSAGLAQALAQVLPQCHAQALPPAPAENLTSPTQLTLVMTASQHPVLQKQWQHLQTGPAVRQVFTLKNKADSDGVDVLVDVDARVTSAGHQTLLLKLSTDAPLSPQQAHDRLTQQTQWIAQHLPRPTRLVVVGGDGLLALCRATQTTHLDATPSPRLGWGAARLGDGIWAGVPCYSRSGAFGPPDDLCQFLSV